MGLSNTPEETAAKISEKLKGNKNGKGCRDSEFRYNLSIRKKEEHKNKKDSGWTSKPLEHLEVIITEEIVNKIKSQYPYLYSFPRKEGVIYFYVLSDPTKNNEIKYVGKSIDPLTRFNEHLADYKFTYNSKTCWIVHLLHNNQVPDIKIIETYTDYNWSDREKYWIQFYKDQGKTLLNLTEGGDGCHNPSLEIRAKKSKSMTGKKFGPPSEEKRAKISASLMGHEVTEETREKLAQYRGEKHHAFNTTFAQGHCDKISKAMSGPDSNNAKAQKAFYADPVKRAERQAKCNETRRKNKEEKARLKSIEPQVPTGLIP